MSRTDKPIDHENGPALVECHLRIPESQQLFDQIESNAAFAHRMAAPNSHLGDTVVICGAGPSLAEYAGYLPHHARQVWACNSALPYLMEMGVHVTHGFAIDQNEAMLGPNEWQQTYPVRYYVSSSIHPKLTAHLLADHRKLIWFHSHLGAENPAWWSPPADKPWLTYEMFLYTSKYADGVRVGHGLNSVPRAVCLALVMGFSEILVYGADCACAPDPPPMPKFSESAEYAAWMHGLTFYADGRSAAQCYGEHEVLAEDPDLDGRRWVTRADMVISAQHLLQLEANYPGRIRLIGDTLPNAIRGKDATWFEDFPHLSPDGKVVGFGNARLAAPSLPISQEAAL